MQQEVLQAMSLLHKIWGSYCNAADNSSSGISRHVKWYMGTNI